MKVKCYGGYSAVGMTLIKSRNGQISNNLRVKRWSFRRDRWLIARWVCFLIAMHIVAGLLSGRASSRPRPTRSPAVAEEPRERAVS